jgi:hypothetical protein
LDNVAYSNEVFDLGTIDQILKYPLLLFLAALKAIIYKLHLNEVKDHNVHKVLSVTRSLIRISNVVSMSHLDCQMWIRVASQTPKSIVYQHKSPSKILEDLVELLNLIQHFREGKVTQDIAKDILDADEISLDRHFH